MTAKMSRLMAALSRTGWEVVGTILEATPSIAVIADAEDVILRISRFGCQLGGWKPGEIEGLTIAQYVAKMAAADQHGRRLEEHEFPLVRALKGERVVGLEGSFAHAGGERIPVVVNAAPFLLNGEVIGAINSATDLRKFRTLEAELRLAAKEKAALHAELNHRAQEHLQKMSSLLGRTHEEVLGEIRRRESVESELRQAQKLEMIGQLSGGIAHDFNNLLMAVLANLSLLRKLLPNDPKAERLIDGALQGANRGAALTQRLLAFARRQSLQLAPTDICALVRGMRELLERSIGPTIQLRFELGERLPPAMVDANQIELALLNLAINARDAMPDGGELLIGVDKVQVGQDADISLQAIMCASL